MVCLEPVDLASGSGGLLKVIFELKRPLNHTKADIEAFNAP